MRKKIYLLILAGILLASGLVDAQEKPDTGCGAKIDELTAKLNTLKNANSQLESQMNEFYAAAQDSEQLKLKLEDTNKKFILLSGDYASLKTENEALTEQLDIYKLTLQSEEAKIYEKLGNFCVQKDLYDSSIEAFERALELNPENAKVHYNLGVLYEYCLKDTKKAIYHLKECLRVSTDTKSKKDVELLLKMLSENVNQGKLLENPTSLKNYLKEKR